MPSGYPDGTAYATDSIAISFSDIEGWLSGTDNGRPGCGAAGNCPRNWVSPQFNSTREGSFELLEGLDILTVGEQRIGPFPHWTLSTQTAGKRYSHLTLPVGTWYAYPNHWAYQALDEFSTSSIRAAVNFYYDLGSLINFYTHEPSQAGTVQGEYVHYSMGKPAMWATNSVGVHDWWVARSAVNVAPAYSTNGTTSIASATVSGATDADTAIEIAVPGPWGEGIRDVQVFLDGAPAAGDSYRITRDGVKVRVGNTHSSAEVRYSTGACTSNCTIWSGAALPVVADYGPDNAIEVGVRFTSDVGGSKDRVYMH